MNVCIFNPAKKNPKNTATLTHLLILVSRPQCCLPSFMIRVTKTRLMPVAKTMTSTDDHFDVYAVKILRQSLVILDVSIQTVLNMLK